MSKTTVSKKIEKLADWVFDVTEGRKPWQDILEKDPKLTLHQAHQVQFALARRRAAKGNPLIGYKAAQTNVAAQKARGLDGPVIGPLMASFIVPEGPLVPYTANSRNAVEAEVGVLMQHELAGPGVTAASAQAAVGAIMPAIEVATNRTDVKRSHHMTVATLKSGGCVIFGSPMSSPLGIDLRTEGVVMAINGEVRGSATAVEVLGNPYNSLAAIANHIAKYGASLKAGMMLITGAITPPIDCAPGDEVRIDFTRLGSIGCRFTQ